MQIQLIKPTEIDTHFSINTNIIRKRKPATINPNRKRPSQKN